MLRLVFMGSPEFAVPSLQALHEAGHEIALVVTNPDRRRSRGGGEEPTPVKATALQLGLPVLEVDDLAAEAFKERLGSIKADLFVLVAFRILPVELLSLARLGAVNLHASLLPRHRGAAPIHHAILQGDTQTGCTVFQLSEGVDTGGILAQRSTPIGAEETTGELYERLRQEGAHLLVDAVQGLESGALKPVSQNEADATRAPKVFNQDAHVRFDRPALWVHNQIRAMNPAPGSWLSYRGEKLLIRRARVHIHTDVALSWPSIAPGELATQDDRLLLGCAQGQAVELLQVQLPGRKMISGAEFLRSHPVGEGLTA